MSNDVLFDKNATPKGNVRINQIMTLEKKRLSIIVGVFKPQALAFLSNIGTFFSEIVTGKGPSVIDTCLKIRQYI